MTSSAIDLTREQVNTLLVEKLGPAGAVGAAKSAANGSNSGNGAAGGAGSGAAAEGTGMSLPSEMQAKPSWSSVSESGPVAYRIDNFLSKEDCEAVKKMMLHKHEGKSIKTKLRVGLSPSDMSLAARDKFLLQNIENKIGSLLGCPPHSKENPMMGMLTVPTRKDDTTTRVL